MTPPDLRRRHVCVLSLDVVGYSRMMARDDMMAVAALREARTIVAAETRGNQGRLFGTAGDSFMIEFEEPVSAMACATHVQKAISFRNQGLVDAEQIWLRAGIAVGAAIDDEGNLFGDVVNIAARLQEACPTGSILVSGAVEEACAEHVVFRAAGELPLKNIPTPLKTFEVFDQGQPLGAARGDTSSEARRRAVPGLEGVAFLAVLPLRNTTGRDGLDFAARGFSEDLITTLSHTRRFPVIDRSSSFAFRSGASVVTAVGRDLGVQYVVEGEIGGAPEDLSVAMSVSETEFGRLIWSNRFPVEGADVMRALEAVTLQIVARLGGELERAEGARHRSRRESRIGTRGLIWRSRWHLDQLTRRDSHEALRLLHEARELDPHDPEVKIALAHWHWVDVWTQRRAPEEIMALKALALDALASEPADSRCHLLAGLADILLRNIPEALGAFEKAIHLNPSLALGHAEIGSCCIAMGRPEEAIGPLELCLRLNPHDYYVFYVYGELALAHCLLGEWEKALTCARRALHLRPSYWNARMSEVAALHHSGDTGGASDAAEALFARTPKFSRAFIEWLPFQHASAVDFFDSAITMARKRPPH
ncbi:MAG TPA: adenylate/guanylate cyclase domain-containing protein [Hyphomonadaceae bacterium]|nr:adenylate/guanylate cyclase domain-containing protein [Hyphomonadaceae bacterium]